MDERKFPGKVILFGEYTVLEGYRALALPHPDYSGHWAFGSSLDERLLNFYSFLSTLSEKTWITQASLERFKNEIAENILFSSNIPAGYGVGSSGAFVAAWYHRYVGNSKQDALPVLQQRMALLESHFHGKSSGLDPLVSLMQTAMMVNGKGVKSLHLPSYQFPPQLGLYDTGISRETGPIVSIFQQKMRGSSLFREKVLPALGIAQELAIDAYLLGEWQTVGEQMRIISKLQYEHFEEMIPRELREQWKGGWANGNYLKLCGAGGGGFMIQWSESAT